ncbi:glycine zipper 2TM domain-containing protein [Rhodanobacter sp. DHB23]|uniref:glycine zipper 2TM domain-containing protein n=1 Tax=Rhodanobacter sp. DHB23 TaxID=2775923 RepID=UPI0017804633|nr:glycine zipper 2TM domain-containing protein [Rhodanobacter sp. DHB23]MBD8871886.1 glycine zipper 2TM domain-containing protein [Rhodanobacter sp. DHB23]
MKKLMVNALNVGIAAALAVGLSACNRSADAGTQVAQAASSAPAPAAAPVAPAAPAGPQYAQVVSVTPVHSTSASQQVCHDVVVNQAAPPKDQHNVAGTAIGAVAGGLLGHMVGGGKGNTLATVAGAVGGGYAGNRIENAHHQPQVTQSVQRQCNTVAGSDKIVGYDVQYVYNGVTRTTRMDHDPGDRVQVQEGVTAVSDAR